jgi:type IV secretory pathway component VirB8
MEMDNEILLHQQMLEQRHKWQFLSFILMFIVVVQTVLIGFLTVKVANKKESVRYVEFSERGDFGFKVVQDSNIDLSQKKLLIEQQLEQYVVDRVTNVVAKKSGTTEIDSPKVQFVSAFSSKDVHKQYEGELLRIYNEATFTKRDINILSFSEIEERKYRFDFETIDSLPNNKIIKKRWVVHLKYDLLDPNELKINEHKEINPLGVKITYYRGDVDRKQKVNVHQATRKRR